MSYNVQIDISKWDEKAQKVLEALGEAGSFFEQFLNDRVIPQLESQAGSQRHVRTGVYMGTWEASQEGERSAIVTTQSYYWRYLEFGTRSITAKPVVGGVVSTIPDELTHFIAGALQEAID